MQFRPPISTSKRVLRPIPVLLGSNVTYKIEVENDGPGNATGVTITDTLPASLTNISAPGCSVSGQTVTCNIGNLANHQKVTRTITAKTMAGRQDHQHGHSHGQ